MVGAITGVVGLYLVFNGVPSWVTPPAEDTAVVATTPPPVASAPFPAGTDAPEDGPAPTTEVPLTGIESVNGLGTWERGPVTMGGKRYADGIATSSGWDVMIFSTREEYKSLTVMVGLADGSADHSATVTFKDGRRTIESVPAALGKPVRATVDLTGVVTLRITAEPTGGKTPTIALGDPVLHGG
ncbi:NPCBM/NEW2 domain-containing protein [Streptomyces sp. CAU 1734]|uniref:NPCBM/NEW2 domain-containing protein n=1 Tax=Streptomyces sp. CAU 1734 TaxID=3140360 RepID=UPI0032603ECF